MKKLLKALNNMLATGDKLADLYFVFYNISLAGLFFLIVLIMGDTKLLLTAVAMLTGFLGLVITWALAFYEEV